MAVSKPDSPNGANLGDWWLCPDIVIPQAPGLYPGLLTTMPTIQAAASLGLLLIAPLNSTLFLESPCLSQNFLGHYRNGDTTSSLFRLETPDCVQVASNTHLSQEHNTLLATPSPGKRLVWIEHESIDASLLQYTHQGPTIDNVLDALSPGNTDEAQQTLSTSDTPVSPILYRTDTSFLVALPADQAFTIDTLLPRFWKSTIVPESPSSYRVVSDDNVERVRSVLHNLKFSPVVASVVNNISIPQIHNDIHFLTGEDGRSGIVSRHSFSTGAITAANWIKGRIEETGAKCRLENFLSGFAPNVICRYASIVDTNDTIIISGHYDSRGSFGSVRAPGGDDDGSGTTGILSIARTIARKRIKFHTNFELVTFAGEEQGLLGSRAYSRQLRAQDASVVLMIQADMTAYRAPDEPLQLGLPERIGTPEVTALVGNISALYSPELTVGYSPASATLVDCSNHRRLTIPKACCSDHQSFIEQGFPASQVFERAGPIADPMYHNSGDLSERAGYDVNQLYAIAKVQFATALHVAGFEFADSQ